MGKCDICYLVSLGFSARMILHTDLISELKKAGFNQISVILPGPNDGSFDKFDEKLGIKTYYADIKNSFWTNEYMIFRKYVYEDIRLNPALWEKHVKSVMDYSGINPWRKIKPHLYLAVNYVIRQLRFLKKIFKIYERAILRNKNLKKLIKDIDPDILISTYPVNYIEGSGLHIAKELKITTVTQLLSWDNITCKGKFPALSDYFISWGKIMSDELVNYYAIERDRIFTTGVPHFDMSKKLISVQSRNRYIEELGLDSGKPYIFFGMSSPYFSPKEIDIVERLADLISRNIFGDDMQFLIRPHPQNVKGEMADTSWLERLENLRSDRVAIDYPIIDKGNLPWNINEEDLDKLSNLISGCSILINSGSTISIEGFIHDKPVILTFFDGDASLKEHNSARRIRDFLHLRKIIDTKAAKVVYHYEELKMAILKYIKDPTIHTNERMNALKMECGNIDGKSSERIAKALLKIKG